MTIDFNEFSTLVSEGLKNSNLAADLANKVKGFFGPGDDGRISREEALRLTSSVYDSLIKVQASIATIQVKMAELNETIMSLNDFTERSPRYEMTKAPGGAIVYTLKEPLQPGETFHFACANCIRVGVISALQTQDSISCFCPACGVKGFQVGQRSIVPPQIVE